MKKRIWVVDDFYPDPHAIRTIALNAEYFEGGPGRGFMGKRSVYQYLFPGLKEAFEGIMGEKITEWESHDVNGRFQICIAGEQLVYHADMQKWAAVLYLTPNAPVSTGTSFFAHKETHVRHKWDQDIDKVFHENTLWLDRTPYESVDVVGNVFNRIVIFDAGLIHSASEYFGNNIENGRLFQVFFFS